MTIRKIFDEVSKREFELFEKDSNGEATADEIVERKQCDVLLHFLHDTYGFTLSNCGAAD